MLAGEKVLTKLEVLAILTPTTSSEFAALLVLVPKKDGSIRLHKD